MKWGDPSFSELLFGGYLGMLTLLWTGLVAGVGRWQRRFALPDAPATPLPPLTVCIPARDEAHQVGDCVRAALAQDHPDLEVVLVDDCSTDGTAAAALAAAGGDPRLRVVGGLPPGPGWAGKPWACARAASEARGAHLLFVDADVVLAPHAARRAAEVLVARRLALLSVFGTWRLETFWERAAIPVVGWFVRGSVDVDAVNTPGRPEAFANGQFILVDRAAYDAVGGHGAVRAEVLEDVRLARAFKQRGQPIALHHAPDLYTVRLYRSLREVLAGYTKNFYEGMDRRPHVALGALLFLFIGYFAPWLILAGLVAAPAVLLAGMDAPGPWTAWTATVCLLPFLLRFRLERADGRSGAATWTQPLGNLVLGAVLLGALFRVRATWKGREFRDGKAVGP